MRTWWVGLGIVVVGIAILSRPLASQEGGAGPPTPPPARKIPGITAEDAFPGGCVDCHIQYPDLKLDVRMSTLLREWSARVEPALLAAAQGLMPEGITLKGKHPPAETSLKDIPDTCIDCHAKNAKFAPPLAPLLHRIHFSGGDANNFLTIFQGECTHCHKLAVERGTWSVPSAPEK